MATLVGTALFHSEHWSRIIREHFQSTSIALSFVFFIAEDEIGEMPYGRAFPHELRRGKSSGLQRFRKVSILLFYFSILNFEEKNSIRSSKDENNIILLF
jgi:hypothetical protein